jgi:hypothetical protein
MKELPFIYQKNKQKKLIKLFCNLFIEQDDESRIRSFQSNDWKQQV